MRTFIFLLLLSIQLGGDASSESCITETQYVPLITMGKVPDDMKDLSLVDEKFKADTSPWNIYKEG